MQHEKVARTVEHIVVMQLKIPRIEHTCDLPKSIYLCNLCCRYAKVNARSVKKQPMATISDKRDLAPDITVVIVQIHKVELRGIISEDSVKPVGKLRFRRTARYCKLRFFRSLQCICARAEPNGPHCAVLTGQRETHIVFASGNQTENQKLVLRRIRVAALGCTRKVGNARIFARLGASARLDRVGKRHGILGGKADITAQRVGAERIDLCKRVVFPMRSFCIFVIEG